MWEDGEIVDERTWWKPASGRPAGGAQELGEPDARHREPAPARRRARRRLPVGRPRLEPHHRARRRRPTDQLRTFSVAFSDPLYDERAYQDEVADGARHAAPRGGGRPGGDRRRLPGRGAARRDADGPHGPGAALPAGPRGASRASRWWRPARAPTSCSGATTSSRRWSLRRLHAQDPARAEELLDRLYPYLGAGAGRRGPAWQQFFLETGAGDDPLFSHHTRVEATADGQGLLQRRRGGRAGRHRSAGAAALRPARRLRRSSVISNARRSSRSRRCSSPTCWPPRAIAWRWPTVSRVAIPSSTTGSSRTPSACRRRTSSTASTTRSRCGGSPTQVLPASIAAPAQAALPRTRGRAVLRRGAPEWVDHLLSPESLARVGICDPARSPASCGAAAPAGRRASARTWPSWGSSRPSSGTSRSAESSKEAMNPKTWNRG